jgi:nucleoside-diphosphate-sugar epimerase
VATLLKYLSHIKEKIDSFIYFSTSKLNEENILEPDKHISNKYYYLSKLLAENVLFDKSYLFNKLLILRCPTIFGKGKKKSNLTNLLRCYMNKQPVIIPRDQKLFNACTSVTDLFLICQKTINRSDSWAKIFEVGSSNKTSIYCLLQQINKKNVTNIRLSKALKTAKLLKTKKISSFLNVGLSPLDKIIRCKI